MSICAHKIRRIAVLLFAISLVDVALMMSCGSVRADDKPPLAPDPAEPLTTISRISATIEFGLPALASAIERDIPKRLATIDERISCVHRRVLLFRVNANCDVSGFIERSGPVALYGRGDRVYGSVPIYGAVEGQGANRFTARIHGETEASATVEIEARPDLRQDWSLDLNFSDGFRWSEPPVLHVMGREISLAKYAEPRIRTQLGRVRSRALAAVARLELRDKATKAWQAAFEPIKLSDQPEVWLQLAPQTAAFAGVRADARALWGSLELGGSAATILGRTPAATAAAPLPALGSRVVEPGTFDIVLPVQVDYAKLGNQIMALGAETSDRDIVLHQVDIYPSNGRLVVGLRFAKSGDANSAGGDWIYFTARPLVDTDKQTIQLSELSVQGTPASESGKIVDALMSKLKDQTGLSYSIASQNLLNAANERLTRPLKNSYRMEGHLEAAKLERVALTANALTIALHATGTLKILYGL